MRLASHHKMFEEQMRMLEQQQAQELLDLPVDNNGNCYGLTSIYRASHIS
jgi:hypothetical protein